MLRLLGCALSLALIAFLLFNRRGRGALRRYEILFALTFAVALMAISLNPDILNSFLGFFSFEKGNGNRLIGLLVLSNLAIVVVLLTVIMRAGRTELTIDNYVRQLAVNQFLEEAKLPPSAVVVIIPAFNEAENVGKVLRRLPREVLGQTMAPVVVVDGGTDETATVVRRLGHVPVVYPINRGGGSAIKAGYQVARSINAKYVVTLDADGQHDPDELPLVLGPLVRDEADFVNGSRVLGQYDRDSTVRFLGVHAFSWLISLLTLRKFTDTSNAFRAIRVSLLQQLNLRQQQFHTAEILMEASRAGARVIEVPITIRHRASGESKKPKSMRYALNYLRVIFSTWLR